MEKIGIGIGVGVKADRENLTDLAIDVMTLEIGSLGYLRARESLKEQTTKHEFNSLMINAATKVMKRMRQSE